MDKLKLDLTGIFREVSPYQVKLLFRQLIHTSISSFIAAVFITVVLWPVASHQWLMIWFGLVCLIAVARIFLVYRFKIKKPENSQLAPWRVACLILIILAGLTWGSLAFIFDFNWSAFHQFSVITVLFIMALGSIPAYATILPIYLISLATILVPIAAIFMLSGVKEYPLYGLGLLFLCLLLFSISKRYHDSVIKEIGKNHNYRKDYHDLKSSHDELSLALEEKDAEEKIARAVYTRIAKLQPVDKYGIKGLVEPMGHFSGDFIYYALTPQGDAYVLFADFSGHGLPAALGAIPVSSIFYSMTAKGLTPEEIIKELNVNLHAQLSTAQFCCACFIALDPARTHAKIWNGGIPDVLVVSAQDHSIQRISSTNIPLGIQTGEENNNFESISLAKGDVVFAYTDGVIEAWNDEDEVFGKDRLEQHLIENYRNPDLLQIIKSEIDKHSETRIQEDDISMLEVRC